MNNQTWGANEKEEKRTILGFTVGDLLDSDDSEEQVSKGTDGSTWGYAECEGLEYPQGLFRGGWMYGAQVKGPQVERYLVNFC